MQVAILKGVSSRQAAAALAVATVVLSAVAPASARRGATIFQSRHLWATIDVCNTKTQPRTVGVRGSMPGSGVGAERMFMRFRVQYHVTGPEQWAYVGAAADSGFVPVGSGVYKARQAGRSFRIAPAATAGTTYVLRGVVDFEWRRGTRAVRHARKATTAGHVSLAGSDPPGYSAAACSLS